MKPPAEQGTSTSANTLAWVPMSGTPHEIGRALGRRGREAVHRHLIGTELWKQVTGSRHAAATQRMMRRTRSAYPWIHAEIEGLSDGLGVAFDDVFAWNCRGDLLADTSDGCTTLLMPGATPVVAHNEDGLGDFEGHCFIADVSTADGHGFRVFCYPGSICGHTFAVTDKGTVMTADNLRLKRVTPEIPRMVLSRAVLGAPSLDAVPTILRDAPPSGGFHLAMAQAGDPRVLSIEYGGGRVGVRHVVKPSIHANHALLLSERGLDQIITDSSRDRQARGEAMLAEGQRDPMTILRDRGGPGWPIWRRDAADPDGENTLASAVFRIHSDRVCWSFHDGASETAVHASHEHPI